MFFWAFPAFFAAFPDVFGGIVIWNDYTQNSMYKTPLPSNRKTRFIYG
jgi:hypothetical protein